MSSNETFSNPELIEIQYVWHIGFARVFGAVKQRLESELNEPINDAYLVRTLFDLNAADGPFDWYNYELLADLEYKQQFAKRILEAYKETEKTYEIPALINWNDRERIALYNHQLNRGIYRRLQFLALKPTPPNKKKGNPLLLPIKIYFIKVSLN